MMTRRCRPPTAKGPSPRVEMGIGVQGIDRKCVGAVSRTLRDEVQEFAGSSNSLNLLI